MGDRTGGFTGEVQDEFTVKIEVQELQGLGKPVAPLVQDLCLVFGGGHVLSLDRKCRQK
jgi:hypothetical protein